MASSALFGIKPKQNGQSLQLTPDDEIKQLKEYIKQIYFKENDDRETINDLIQEIDELEGIKLDEDFFEKLYNIYSKVIKRQEQNLIEFKKFSTIIEIQRQEIEEKAEQIIKILDDHTQYKLDGVKSNLKMIDNQLVQLESELFTSEEGLNTHVQQICQTVKRSKQDFDNDMKSVSVVWQENKEEIKEQQKLQEQTKAVVNSKIQEQESLKKEMQNNQKQLDKICSHIIKLESENTKTSLIQQAQKEQELLCQKRESLDQQISLRNVDFKELQLDNTIVEKRQAYFVSKFASDYIQGRQKDQLKSEVDRMEQDYNILRKKVEIIQENTKKINQEIAIIRKKKDLKQTINLYLIIIILLISFGILYKFY